ncbi:sulfite exporter TauE/SafE family protein, partial [Planktomarina sp.]|nr:sulfite exporter TauE/SafE family protein [Planktomarina sp.]
MTQTLSLYTADLLLLIAATAVIAGMVKGIVGFAMPMIFITGMTIFVGPDLALGILILPTLVTNGWQAGRQGFTAALSSLYD